MAIAILILCYKWGILSQNEKLSFFFVVCLFASLFQRPMFQGKRVETVKAPVVSFEDNETDKKYSCRPDFHN